MRTPKGAKYDERPMRPTEAAYFDYYLVVNPRAFTLPLPTYMRLWRAGPDFDIYRVLHGPSGAID